MESHNAAKSDSNKKFYQLIIARIETIVELTVPHSYYRGWQLPLLDGSELAELLDAGCYKAAWLCSI